MFAKSLTIFLAAVMLANLSVTHCAVQGNIRASKSDDYSTDDKSTDQLEVRTGAFEDWFTIPPATVPSLDPFAYQGRWYQMYGSFLSNTTFEKDGYCVIADYAVLNATSIAVVNSENIGCPAGTLNQKAGILIPDRSNEPGKWLVLFEGMKLPGFYWIIKLGPLSLVTGLYDYAVVSVPFGYDLYVLARNAEQFRALYQATLIAELEAMGFSTIFNKPRETYQGSDCAYPPVPGPFIV